MASFNTYVRQHNADHVAEIAAGSMEPLQESTVEFIDKASGIKSRYVIDNRFDHRLSSLPQ